MRLCVPARTQDRTGIDGRIGNNFMTTLSKVRPSHYDLACAFDIPTLTTAMLHGQLWPHTHPHTVLTRARTSTRAVDRVLHRPVAPRHPGHPLRVGQPPRASQALRVRTRFGPVILNAKP